MHIIKENIKKIMGVIFIVVVIFIIFQSIHFKKSVSFRIQVASGLEISVDGKNWGEEITWDMVNKVSQENENAMNQLPRILGSFSTVGTVTNGYLDMYQVQFYKNRSAITASKVKDIPCTHDTSCEGNDYVVFDMYLKVDKPSTLKLTNHSQVLKNGVLGSDLSHASRVAFINEGTVALENSDIVSSLKGGEKSVIWEPNTSGDIADTKGICSEIASEFTLKDIDNASYFSTVPSIVSTEKNFSEDKDLMEIPSGITKMRVYMWIESLDKDVNKKVEANNLDFVVEFGI